MIAHEFGPHIQNLTGVMDKVQRAGQNNRLSVALELQADCYAGIWANYATKRGIVETGDAGPVTPVGINLPNDHLHYALTWFGLALTLVGVFATFAWRRLYGSGDELQAQDAGNDQAYAGEPQGRRRIAE